MGYTTEFNGQFDCDPHLTEGQMAILRDFAGRCHDGEKPGLDYTDPRGLNKPGSYCQWVPAEDGSGIEWDGGEKFYDWEAWLTYLHDGFLKPWGIKLTGSVTWHGEETDDTGVLSVVDGKVVAEDLPSKLERSASIEKAAWVLQAAYDRDPTDIGYEMEQLAIQLRKDA
jgi:hypothetical protein